MRVVSWNVNGIRAGVRHGFVDFVDRSAADIVGVQEVRARPEDIPPAARRPPGWHTAFTVAERRGYSGVGLYSKLQPVRVDTSLRVPRFDREGRFMAAHFQTARGRFVVVNGYFPRGKRPGPGQQPGRLQTRLLSDSLYPGASAQTPRPGRCPAPETAAPSQPAAAAIGAPDRAPPELAQEIERHLALPARPPSVAHSFSKPWLVNFSARLFSVTVRTT